MRANGLPGRRLGWAVAIVLLGLIAVHRGWRGWEARRVLEQQGRAQRMRNEELEEAARAWHARTEALRAEVEAARREASLAAARLADATAAEFEAHTVPGGRRDDQTPPEHRPFWNPGSEFVWISKTMLARWPIPGLMADGALSAEAVAGLGLPESQAQRLNHRLRGLLDEFHVQDRNHARVMEEHLPGIAEKAGAKLTVRVDFDRDLVHSMRARFQMALREELGEQRSGIVHEWAEEWLAEQFPLGPAAAARTISVVRHPDGAYTLRSRLGDQDGFMVSGPMNIEDYVPMHLRSLFDPVTRE